MPFGLLEYMVNFFNSTPGSNVECPKQYDKWLQTMYVLFGQKFSRIFSGPMWSIESTTQGAGSDTVAILQDPLKARVNVPAVGERTLRRHIASSEYTTGSGIQFATLDEAHRLHPSSKWWVKADGCDVVSGLEESVRNEWNGDVDLGNGELLTLYNKYLDRSKRLLSLLDSCVQNALRVLHQESVELREDILFVSEALKRANEEYSDKLQKAGTQQKILLTLAWKLDDLSRLLQE